VFSALRDVRYMFVVGHVGCCGGYVWVSQVAYFAVIVCLVCVCGLGIPLVGWVLIVRMQKLLIVHALKVGCTYLDFQVVGMVWS